MKRIHRLGTSLSGLETDIVVAMLDAAASLKPKETVAWNISQWFPYGNALLIVRVDIFNPAPPDIAGLWDSGQITSTLYDGLHHAVCQLAVKICRSHEGVQQSVFISQGNWRNPVCFGLVIRMMLDAGIAPDKGSNRVLDEFFGAKGLVDRASENHRKAASAALKRNPKLHDYFSAELTAALL